MIVTATSLVEVLAARDDDGVQDLPTCLNLRST
jgi:hypothetical protein